MTTLTLNYTSSATLPGLQAFSRLPAWDLSGSAHTAQQSKLRRPEWATQIADRVRYLRKLRTGWDGYSSVPIQDDILFFSLSILDSVMRPNSPPPFIAPVSGGGLQIEWHEGGLDIELYISQPLSAELYVEYSDGREPLEMELVSDFGALDEALSEIVG